MAVMIRWRLILFLCTCLVFICMPSVAAGIACLASCYLLSIS